MSLEFNPRSGAPTIAADSAPASAQAGIVDVDGAGLSRGVLSESQVVAQSVGMVGPSLAAASLIPIAFATAGNGSWLTVVIAVAGLLAIAYVVAYLSRRHVVTGALYTLVPKGLGSTGGLLTAGAVFVVATCGVIPSILATGSTLAEFLQSGLGIGHSGRAELLVFDFLALAAVTTVVLRGIKLSTDILLILELSAMTLISVLLVIILVDHGHIIDTSQLKLSGTSSHGILTGIAIMITAFGGFESAASLGVEARNPRRAVPLALVASVGLVGLFFVINAYVQILGFEGTGIDVTAQAVPLSALASHYGVAWLGNIILLGVALSWFATTCAAMNYAIRVLMTMGVEGVLPRQLGRTSSRTGTPYVAVGACVTLYTVVIAFLAISDANLTDVFGDLATVAGYGFSAGYLLMALAAISYAFRHGSGVIIGLVVAGVAAGAVMVLEFWFSFNPLPAAPLRTYAFAFVGFCALMVLVAILANLFAPGWVRRIGRAEEPVAS